VCVCRMQISIKKKNLVEKKVLKTKCAFNDKIILFV
jgi:hypothetical protein